MKVSFLLFDSVKIFSCVVYTHTRSKLVFQEILIEIRLDSVDIYLSKSRFPIITSNVNCYGNFF